MTGTVEKAVTEIKRGKRYPVYLLHGDEFLAKAGARAIVDALVPPARQSLNVETVTEEADLASLPIRLNTVPLFGGTKIIVVHDSKAFVSKQNLGNLASRSFEAWEAGDAERAARLLLQVVAATGESENFLSRAARGEISGAEWDRVLSMEAEPEAEQWLREVAGHAVTDRMPIPEATGAGLARIFEDTIQRGIPADASLILTTEVVDERRALFKRISAVGVVIDCGVRSRRSWDTQMEPEAARAKIREMVTAAGKTIAGDASAAIVERTGLSMRGLESEMEKVLLYIGSRPTITASDVMDVLSNSREANIFDLTNAVSGRDAGKAFRALRSLLTRREPAGRILSTLAGEMRSLIVARSALEQRLAGTLDVSIPFEAFRSRILPRLARESEGDDGSAAKLLAMNPFRAFNVLKGAARFSMPELVRGLVAIHAADLALKTSGYPEDLIMEQLLITLCASA